MNECINCQNDLSGGEYIAPWEDGDNSCGYVICPHCGYKNEDYSDED